MTTSPPPPRSTSGRAAFACGVAILAGFALVAVAAPLFAPYPPDARVAAPFSRPTSAHVLGSDDIGQDLFSLLLYGARTSLLVAAVAAGAATTIGAVVGGAAGAARGVTDAVLMRLVDVTLSLPFLPLMIVVGAFLGPGIGTQILVITAVMWAAAARELRSQVLSLRERDHVQAARAMGASPRYLVVRHLLPGVGPLIIPEFVVAAKRAVMFEAALSFLGLGAAGTVSWGTMLFDAHRRSAFLTDAWLWWVLPPGLAIAATVVGLALVGSGVEQRLRPPRRPRRIPAVVGPTTISSSPMPPTTDAVLSIESLSVDYVAGRMTVTALEGASLEVRPGERVGIVGASGSGKSTLVLASMGLLAGTAVITGGRVLVEGRDLAERSSAELCRLRGGRVSLVPQQAAAALDPVIDAGDQIGETLRLHGAVGRTSARRRAGELLGAVGLDRHVLAAYPHQLSGGMRQRVVLAIALANDPALLVLDEPTTGLDVVAQVELLDLLDRLRHEHGTATLTVSHDIAAIVAASDRVAVMDAGRIVETGSTSQVLRAPGHASTRALLGAVPRMPSGVRAPGPRWAAAAQEASP